MSCMYSLYVFMYVCIYIYAVVSRPLLDTLLRHLSVWRVFKKATISGAKRLIKIMYKLIWLIMCIHHIHIATKKIQCTFFVLSDALSSESSRLQFLRIELIACNPNPLLKQAFKILFRSRNLKCCCLNIFEGNQNFCLLLLSDFFFLVFFLV